MFRWLQGDEGGLPLILRQFAQMLEDGRHVFDAASNTLLGGADPAVVARDLFATDKRINAVEQAIRRELVVHATLAERGDLPICFTLMSLVKDAERIGDYAKNIHDLSVRCRDFHEDPTVPELVILKDKVSRMLAKMRNLYESQNAEQSRAFLEEADSLLDLCDRQVDRLITEPAVSRHPVVAALMYRYVKRVLAHATNVVTAIVMPIDKLDFFDEDKETRGP